MYVSYVYWHRSSFEIQMNVDEGRTRPNIGRVQRTPTIVAPESYLGCGGIAINSNMLKKKKSGFVVSHIDFS